MTDLAPPEKDTGVLPASYPDQVRVLAAKLKEAEARADKAEREADIMRQSAERAEAALAEEKRHDADLKAVYDRALTDARKAIDDCPRCQRRRDIAIARGEKRRQEEKK